MTKSDTIVFFHSPQHALAAARASCSRSSARRYELRVVNMKAASSGKPAFLAVNPMGKVPAILHRGALVTEQGAIFIYLADLFPQAGLAPGLDDRAARALPALDGLLRLLLRAGRGRPRAEARAGAAADVALWRLRHDAQDADRPARQGAVPARRPHHRGRRAVGHGADLDDDVQARPRAAGDQGLRRADRRAARVAKVKAADAALAAEHERRGASQAAWRPRHRLGRPFEPDGAAQGVGSRRQGSTQPTNPDALAYSDDHRRDARGRAALAQTKDPAAGYPNHTVRIIVSAPPGGGPDLAARLVADKLQRRWGQPFIIENRARRRRHARHRRRRGRRARRLHAALGAARPAHHPCAALQEPALRSGRARARDRHDQDPDRAGGADGFSRQHGRAS